MSTRDKPVKSPRLRRLSEEEIDLWRSVAATVVRRPDAALPEATPPPAPPQVEAISAPRPRLYAAAPYVPPTQKAAPSLAPLERKLKQRLSRGRMSADAALDLHGFRQAEAQSALRHFLLQAQSEGARVVLVVTGKGGRAADPYDMTDGGIGVLKRSVPLWLAQPEFRALVVGFEDAGRAHGGSGALYVRLRRRG